MLEAEAARREEEDVGICEERGRREDLGDAGRCRGDTGEMYGEASARSEVDARTCERASGSGRARARARDLG